MVALALSLVPGWGHVYWRRETLGLLLFTVGATFAFGWINAVWIYRGEGRELLAWVAGILFLATWAFAWIDLYLRTAPARLARDAESRALFLEQGTIAFLRGDFENAEVNFRGALQLDPQDVEALFRLGITLSRWAQREARAERVGGEPGRESELEARAIRVLHRTLRHDVEEKWRWEILREIDALAGPEHAEAEGHGVWARSAGGRSRDGGGSRGGDVELTAPGGAIWLRTRILVSTFEPPTRRSTASRDTCAARTVRRC